MTEITELRECPFCGGEASHSMDCDETEYPFAIECDECHVCTDRYSEDEMAVKAWNRRALPTRPGALIEALQPIIREVEELPEIVTDDSCYQLSRHGMLGLAEFDVGDLRRIREALSAPAIEADGKKEDDSTSYSDYDTEKLVRLLSQRDEFIVSRGLWMDFVRSLAITQPSYQGER